MASKEIWCPVPNMGACLKPAVSTMWSTTFHTMSEPSDLIKRLMMTSNALCPPRTPTRQTYKSVLFLTFVTDVYTVFK